ncbi:MAG: protein kinase [Candidatus Hydrogenedentes bacterium]|nr:protein kinase [Candidatus Hydrogenedentota bacterium]
MTASPNTAPQTYMLGNFEIIESVGIGGMGIVYRAQDTALNRSIALKILREDLRANASIVARFQREAEAFATLNHPNIVRIYSVGKVGNIPYLAMEFITGKPLSEILQDRGPLPWQEALMIGRQVAEALSCAHASGIIHRDIKPANIIVMRDGTAKVTDFGIAKVLNSTEELTVDGARLGTPQYMCPERCQNLKVTPSSDIYSLGVVLFQLISGRLPFEATSSVDLIRRITSEAPTRLRQLAPNAPEPVERLLACMMERDSRGRPQNAGEVSRLIQHVLDGGTLENDSEKLAQMLESYRKSIPTPAPETRARETSRVVRLRSGFAEFWFGLAPLVRILIAAAIVLALFGGLVWGGVRFMRSDVLLPTPASAAANARAWHDAAPVARFYDETADIYLAQINLPGFRVTQMAELKGASGILLQLDGDAASARSQQRAVLVLNPEMQTASVAIAPVVASGAADFRLLGASGSFNGTPGYFISMPGTTEFYALGNDAPPVQVADVAAASMALQTQGERLLLAYTAGDEAQWVLAETALNAFYKKTLLTASGPEISSPAYSASGRHIAYLRRTGPDTHQLYVIDTEAPKQDGAALQEGRISLPARPFSPDGQRLLLSSKNETGESHMQIPAVSGAESAQILPDVVAAAWHPVHGYLLAVKPDRGKRNQLYAIDPASPGAATQLTYLSAGIQPLVLVTGEGAQAIAALADGPSIAVVRLPEKP